MIRSLALALVSMALGACQTPCEALGAHAEECGTAAGVYADERHSVCTATESELSTPQFDDFAACVDGAACDDAAAVDRCMQAAVGSSVSPCLRFKLWASACGLEPLQTEEECTALTQGMGEVVFPRWVECITAGGCPTRQDERYKRCQDEVVPPDTTELLDACVIIVDWRARCAGQGGSLLTISETTLTECLVEAEPFTSESYLAYAQCLSALECDDTSGRILCIGELALVSPSAAATQCQQLDTFAATCGSLVGGGSAEACERLLARFTSDSITAYVDCITARPCEDQTAALDCAPLLSFE